MTPTKIDALEAKLFKISGPVRMNNDSFSDIAYESLCVIRQMRETLNQVQAALDKQNE